MQDPDLADRLASLWDHLGLQAAHVAAQMPSDLEAFAGRHPDKIAGLLFCEATSLDPASFRALAQRTTLVAGDAGISGRVADAAAPQLPGCRRVVLAGYGEPLWADSVSHRTAEIVAALNDLPGSASAPSAFAAATGRGSHAGISWRIEGAGPALVLLPFLLSAAQWDAAVPTLAKRYSVVLLGGRHLGGAALLEERATSPTYAGMVSTMLEVMAPAPGETLLEVGCGSGAVARLAARRLSGSNPITAVDVNAYLLREAAALAEEEGLSQRVVFAEGNAEHLPFEDASFDHAYSVTVLEECDADIALRELRRVVRPGGRVGIIVRATDMPHAWHVDLPEPLRTKVDTRPPLVGPRGVADRSLYPRAKAAGLDRLVCFPTLVSVAASGGPFFRYLEGNVLSRLSPEERQTWETAQRAARDAGLLFTTNPHHCVVGWRPSH